MHACVWTQICVCMCTCVHRILYIEIKSSKMHVIFEQGVMMIRKDLVGVRDPGEWSSLNGWQRRKHGNPRGEAPSNYVAKFLWPPDHLLRGWARGAFGLGGRAQGWDKLLLVYKDGIAKRSLSPRWPCLAELRGGPKEAFSDIRGLSILLANPN